MSVTSLESLRCLFLTLFLSNFCRCTITAFLLFQCLVQFFAAVKLIICILGKKRTGIYILLIIVIITYNCNPDDRVFYKKVRKNVSSCILTSHLNDIFELHFDFGHYLFYTCEGKCTCQKQTVIARGKMYMSKTDCNCPISISSPICVP